MSNPSSAARLGFIGLGTMGLPMAVRLAKHGYRVAVCDPNASAISRFAEESGQPAEAASAGALMESCDVVMTCLPTVEAVREVYLGEKAGLVNRARAGLIVVEYSTAPPPLAREIGERFASRGTLYVEAPLFGGLTQAQEGTLFLALAGPPTALAGDTPIAPLRSIFGVVSRGFAWAGGPGAAMAVKVLQNGLGLIQLAGMAQVAAACRGCGVDPELFGDIVMRAGGMAASPLFQQRFPRMVAPDGRIEARLAIAAKDARLLFELLGGGASPRSPAAMSHAVFSRAMEMGLADADPNEVWRVFEHGA